MRKSGDKVYLTVILDSRTDKKTAPAIDTQPQITGVTSETITDGPPATTVSLEIENSNVPPRLKQGDHIRVWRYPDNPQKTWRISFGRGHDPTGVRSRLCGGRRSGGRGSRRGGGKGGHGGH